MEDWCCQYNGNGCNCNESEDREEQNMIGRTAVSRALVELLNLTCHSFDREYLVERWVKNFIIHEYKEHSVFVCKTCGKYTFRRLMPHAYLNGENCHTCSYWFKKATYGPERRERQVIVNHTHYMIGEEFEGPGFRGLGGRGLAIGFLDGRVVITSNLWHQGEIPEHFWDLLPDNANFIVDAEEFNKEEFPDNGDNEIPF